jgi:dimethylsulfoniopropionate demethylase
MVTEEGPAQQTCAIGMVRMAHWEAGTELRVLAPDRERRGVVQQGVWA